ncbi:hypothetical protein ACFL6S_06805 [Candidatus Poribacteria bacterium]
MITYSGMKKFMEGMTRSPVAVQLWVGWLGAVTMLCSTFFVILTSRIEAVLILLASLFGAILMSIITEMKGFTRIMGLGHIAWILLVPYLLTRIKTADLSSVFGIWLVVAVVSMGISLVLDLIDVIRYLRGEKQPLA